MKDSKGHGSNPRGAAAHQTGVRLASEPNTKNVAVATLRPDPSFNMTDWSAGTSGNARIVNKYRKAIRENRPLDPIQITAYGNIIDGHHRYAAAKLEGVSKLRAVVMPKSVVGKLW